MRKKLSLFVAILLCCSVVTMVLAGCNVSGTVTYNSMGGTCFSSDTGEQKTEPIPTKDGYEFGGWYADKAYTGDRIKFPFTPKKATILYAKWTDSSAETRIPEVMDKIGAAIAKSCKIDATKPFGASVNLNVMGIGFNIDAAVDKNNINNVKVKMAISNQGTEVVSLYADDDYLYAVTQDAKKRLKDFQLAEMLSGDFLPNGETVDEYINMINLALNLLFSGADATLVEDGNSYVVQNNLSSLTYLFDQIGLALPSEITDILNQCDVKLEASLNGELLDKITLTIITPIASVPVGAESIKIASDYVPVIDMPSKTDATYDETYGLNFTLEGDVLFQSKTSDYNLGDVVKFKYRVHVDYNIFGLMRNALSIGSDAISMDYAQIFNQPDSKIFFDIYHQCDATCGTFCEGKEGASRGSLLSFAYSPLDFGSSNINLAINLKYLLPKGLINELITTDMDIMSIFGEYVGITLDTTALLQSNSASVAEVANVADSSSSINLIGVLMNVLNFVGDTTVNSGERSMTINVKSLLDIVDKLTVDMAGDLNIANILSKFFGSDTSLMTVSVNNAKYGDATITDMNIYEEYMIISPELGDYKNFKNGSNDFTPAMNTEWILDKDNNVKITNSGILNYDENGNSLPLAESEVRTLLQGGAHYSYTLVDGRTGSGVIEILDVRGLDYSKVGVAQEVTIVTGMADGGAISGLLGIIKMIMPDFNITIPGGIFTTKITITGVQSIGINQPDTYTKDENNQTITYEMLNKYDSEKTYYYDDLLNPLYEAVAVYVGGVTKKITVMPTNIGQFMGNYNNYNAAKIAYLSNFELEYVAFGQSFIKNVKMANQLVVEKDTEVSLGIGEKYTIGTSHRPTYTAKDGTTKTANATGKQGVMTVNCDSANFIVEEHTTQGWFGPQFAGYNISFNAAGTYTLKMSPALGYVKTYVVTVKEKVVLPKYSLSTKYNELNLIELKFGRIDNLGVGLNAKLAITINNKAGEATLLQDTDYEMLVMNNDGELVKLNSLFLNKVMIQPQYLYVRIINEAYIADSVELSVATIDVLATDYDNLSIVKSTNV